MFLLKLLKEKHKLEYFKNTFHFNTT